MSEDVLQAMNAYDDSVYDELLKEAATDTRVGDHDFLITKKEIGTWPDGRPRLKYVGKLLTARDAKTDLTWSPPPSPEVIKEQKATTEERVIRSWAANVVLARQAIEHYGKKITEFSEGEVIRVKTTKDRPKDGDTGGGFIRIRAILAKAGSSASSATSTVGF